MNKIAAVMWAVSGLNLFLADSPLAVVSWTASGIVWGVVAVSSRK